MHKPGSPIDDLLNSSPGRVIGGEITADALAEHLFCSIHLLKTHPPRVHQIPLEVAEVLDMVGLR